MAKATYDYPPDVSFDDAARAALESAFHKMITNAPGTRAGVERREPSAEEVEALHDMRVGSRRLRAALAVFVRLFPKDDFRALDKEIAAVTDALGAVRDLDVQLDGLRSLQEGLPENEAYGLGRLIARQTDQREIERKALLVALERMEKSRFARRFAKALDRALPSPDDEVDDSSVDAENEKEEDTAHG